MFNHSRHGSAAIVWRIFKHVSEAQTNAQLHVIKTVKTRLADVQLQMNERLAENARLAALALSEMQDCTKESLRRVTRKSSRLV